MNLSRLRLVPFVAALLPVDLAVAAAICAAEFLRIVIPKDRSPESLPPPDTRQATIQILNWDGKALLQEFLPTVIAASRGHRVVVVDNGSSDGSVVFVKKEFPSVDVVAFDRNHGFSRGIILVPKHVETDILVCLNNEMA